MKANQSPDSLFVLDRLQAVASIGLGLLVLAMVVGGIVRGEMLGRWGTVYLHETPALFCLGTVLLPWFGFWLVRRGYLKLKNSLNGQRDDA